MKNIDCIIARFFKEKVLPQNFKDKVREQVKSNPNEWNLRVMKCSKSLLAAVCFRETAKAIQRKKDSKIYQPIGLYYSMFHMSLAMLWLNPRIKVAQLKQIHHTLLIKLVKNELELKLFIESFFLVTLMKLKELRESCNYKFGYMNDLDLEVNSGIVNTDRAFSIAIKYIHQVLEVSNSLSQVKIGIADGFGDDIIDSYLTTKHKNNVIKYLLHNGLTA